MTYKVSIITTTYNDCANLAKIIEGVKQQDYPEIEYIIVDGASTDETQERIKEAASFFGERFKWISEPDHGIYDAINKGIDMATGDIVGFLFDEFTSQHVISTIVETIERTGADGVHGDLDYVENGKVVRRWRMGQGNIHFGWMPGHPTLYLKKEVYETYGYYKEDYRIAADYEFMVRILKDKQVTLAYIPQVLVHMFYGGTSTGGLSNYVASFKEGLRALRENQVHFALFAQGLRTLRVLYQFVRK